MDAKKQRAASSNVRKLWARRVFFERWLFMIGRAILSQSENKGRGNFRGCYVTKKTLRAKHRSGSQKCQLDDFAASEPNGSTGARNLFDFHGTGRSRHFAFDGFLRDRAQLVGAGRGLEKELRVQSGYH
jgi:hypothetical protein